MKDIRNLLISVILSVGVILILINLSQSEGVSSNVLVGTAIFFVVILPVILAVKLSKKEKEKEQM